ncbi:MAG TPA: hypothetical protein VFG79_18580 [Solirubrobacter sp.]|nr:hypothetical protein [Solirubrobacter sp.]
MNDRDRLAQLRGLLERLERMPASPDRDWMLAEVRARAVDVETGVRPAALRALPADEADAVHAPRVEAAQPRARRAPCRPQKPRRPQARAATRVDPPPRPPLADAHEPARHESAVDLLQRGGLLWLEDSPPVAAGAGRPWALGLRG